MKKKKKMAHRKKVLPAFKRELSDFVFSEEGRIDKKTVAQIGLTLGLLATVFSPALACHGSSSTPKYEFYTSTTGRGIAMEAMVPTLPMVRMVRMVRMGSGSRYV